jgi:hypothetical protein
MMVKNRDKTGGLDERINNVDRRTSCYSEEVADFPTLNLERKSVDRTDNHGYA